MIKVNLAPFDELENPLWWLSSAVAAVVAGACAYFAVQYYLGTIQASIDNIRQRTVIVQESTTELAKDVKKYKEIDKEITEFKNKLQALRSITESKITRFEPVILMEDLQNLKPEGVWFNNITFMNNSTSNVNNKGAKDSQSKSIQISGNALDNVLIAEFLAALRSTQSQEIEESDLRTQIYFSKITLKSTSANNSTKISLNSDAMQSNQKFDIQIEYKEIKSKEKPKDVALFKKKNIFPKMELLF